MRTPFFLLLFAVVPLFTMFADSGGILDDIMYLPPKYTVGDVVELRGVLSADSGVVPEVPVQLPEHGWLRIHSVRISPMSGREHQGEYDFRMIFSSYYPGTRTLPPLVLGSVILDRIKIHTSPVLREGHVELARLRDQMYFPGTRFILTFIGILVLAGPVLTIALWDRVRRAFLNAASGIRLRQPYRRFSRMLRDLTSSFMQKKDREFYILLSLGLRRYLTDRTGEDYLTLTLEELRRTSVLQRKLGKTMDTVFGLLQFADIIKFSGEGCSQTRKQQDLEKAQKVLHQVEFYSRKMEKEGEDASDAYV